MENLAGQPNTNGVIDTTTQDVHEISRKAKNEKIKAAIQETKERRKNQTSIVVQLKIQNLSKKKEENLKRVFLEAKWLYNWLICDSERLELSVNKVNKVEIRVGDTFEERELTLLGSQIKQAIADEVKRSLRSLKAAKNNGRKVGKLKFKSYVSSIPLKQYGSTHTIDFSRNRIKIQKLGSFRVLGLHRIPADAEIANAYLINKPSGYYVYLTCFVSKEEVNKQKRFGPVAIDFGINSKITMSNGIKLDFELKETKRLKRLHKKLSRTQKGSKNRQKLIHLLKREYEKIVRRRKDIHNRVIAFLKNYEKVIYQEDNVHGWTKLFGAQVNSSGIGSIKARIKNNLDNSASIGRFETTTKECVVCGKINEIYLSERVFKCECGWECDRDVNAALVILKKGLGLSYEDIVGVGRSELTPLEREVLTRIFGSNPYIRVNVPSMKEEAHLWEEAMRL
jgi:putative transposase